MQFRRSPGARPIDREWHQFRIDARHSAFSINEFSQADIIKYNLTTARITGQENPRTYTINRPIDILGVNGTDIRDLPTR